MKKCLYLLLVCFLLCGCTKKDDQKVLNVLNWSSYIPSDIITDFEKSSGIKVNYGTYSSNEELLAKLSASKEGTYDLVFPSDYMVELMINKDMLEKIDKEKVSLYTNINPLFLGQSYDPKNEYSLPFLGATTVIAYNEKNIKEDITGYNDLLNKKYRNNIVMLDDQRIVIGMALLANGYDMNTKSKKELYVAKDWLLKLKPNIKAYDSDSPKTFLITDETDIGLMWNAEATLAKEAHDNIKIVYPKEKHAISIDNYTIVKGAKHQDNAYKFIDYLLSYDVSKKITDEYPYINLTIKAANYTNWEINNILKDGEYVKNIDAFISNYDKTWAETK